MVVGILCILMVSECTWENEGSKDMKVICMEDKRQVRTYVSSTTNGPLSPMQIIFTCKIIQCLCTTQLAIDGLFELYILIYHDKESLVRHKNLSTICVGDPWFLFWQQI